jgi:hypothetical protein
MIAKCRIIAFATQATLHVQEIAIVYIAVVVRRQRMNPYSLENLSFNSH